MRLVVFTPTPDFAKEVGDLVSLFFGDIVLSINPVQPEGDLVIRHDERMEGNTRFVKVCLSGIAEGQAQNEESIYADALDEKRYHKRQLKKCVYEALKAATGIRPPWGSLTGIRPTRLVYEAMETGATLSEAVRSVEREFDVSKSKAALLQEIVSVQSSLTKPVDNDVDIYVGIPFCVSRCRYCSFLSGEIGKGKELAPYTDALIAEIEDAVRLVQEKGLHVRAFYMGGGTPTALPAMLMEKVLLAAQPFIRTASEATVEAGRPDTLDQEKLSLIRDMGASRISINPQTMHDSTLATIGRRHTGMQTEDAYAMARALGFTHINMDLIAGLPGENEAMFEQTLEWSDALHPESLTVHTLSVKRSSLMHLWQDSLPDGNMVAKMVDTARNHAAERGMVPYYLYRQKHQAGNLENVGYALPGHACVYNVDMMEDICSVLALGAGGISKRVRDGRTLIKRAPNVKEVHHYIARVDEMMGRKRELFRD